MTRSTPKKPIGKVVVSMIGRKYEFGGNGKNIGDPFDCFGMLVEYEKIRFGVDLLDRHGHLDFPFFTYKDKEIFPHAFLMEDLKSYLDKCFTKVLVPYILPGDIIWTEADGLNSVGIYLGAQKMLVTAPEVDCITVPTEYYELKDAYRWLLLSQ